MPCPPNEFVPKLVQPEVPTEPKKTAYSAQIFKPYQGSDSDVSKNELKLSDPKPFSKL